MRDQTCYGGTFNGAITRLRTLLPADLISRFSHHSGFDQDSFHVARGQRIGRIVGVDGSNAMVFEGGYFSLAAVRAGQSQWSPDHQPFRAVSPLHLSLVGPESQNTDFESLYNECFGCAPLTPLINEDPSRAASVLRDTLEYWVALEAALSEKKGTLLLLDGALRVTHASHDPVLQRILRTTADRELSIAAVTKRTSATWGGGYPLIPAVDGLADVLGVTPPWWIRIPDEILDHMQFRQWHHGDIFITRLHRHAFIPLKVELPRGSDDRVVEPVMDLLVQCSDDGRIPGYPFPLFDAHRTVVIDHDIVLSIQQDLIGEMANDGFITKKWRQLFGDVHDEFRKY